MIGGKTKEKIETLKEYAERHREDGGELILVHWTDEELVSTFLTPNQGNMAGAKAKLRRIWEMLAALAEEDASVLRGRIKRT